MCVKEFIYINRLKQKELAEYLGVTEASVSRMVKGVAGLTERNLHKLLDNPYGWDTSALLGESPTINANASGDNSTASVNYKSEIGYTQEVDYLKKMVEDLRAQLNEEKTRSAQYWEMIQKLMK